MEALARPDDADSLTIEPAEDEHEDELIQRCSARSARSDQIASSPTLAREQSADDKTGQD